MTFPPLEIRDSASNPEQLCDRHQRRKLLSFAIRRLEPQLRAAIDVQLGGTHAVKDIADTPNISAAAVKTRLHRAPRTSASGFSARGPLQTGVSRNYLA